MKGFKKLGFGLILGGTPLVLGSAVAVSSHIPSTQAAEITIAGKANIDNFTGTATIKKVISFTEPFTTKSSSGLFKDLVAKSIASVYLSSTHPSFTVDSETEFYTGNVLNAPFISFTDGSRFEIANPFEVSRYLFNDSFELFSVFEGRYINNTGGSFRVGIVTITEVNNITGEDNFSMTLTNICCSPTPIPEPTSTGAVTILGLSALAFAQKVIRSKKISKKPQYIAGDS